MSECVVRMEMPENCCECQLRQEDYEMGEEFCPFTGVECLSIGRQNNCPIVCSIPEGHGRLVDADELKAKQQEDADLFINAYTLMEKSRRDEALNAVANIVNAPTIVPAERSET